MLIVLSAPYIYIIPFYYVYVTILFNKKSTFLSIR